MAKTGPDGRNYSKVPLILLGPTQTLRLNLGLYPTNSRRAFKRQERHTRECGGTLAKRQRCGDHVFEPEQVFDESTVTLDEVMAARELRHQRQQQAEEDALALLGEARNKAAALGKDIQPQIDRLMAEAKAAAEERRRQAVQESGTLQDVPRKTVCGHDDCRAEMPAEPQLVAHCQICGLFHEGKPLITYLQLDGTPIYLTDQQLATIETLRLDAGIYAIDLLPGGYHISEELVGDTKQVGPAGSTLDYTIMFHAMRRINRPLLVIYVTKNEKGTRDFRFEHVGLLRLSANGKGLVMITVNTAEDVLLQEFNLEDGDHENMVDAMSNAINLLSSGREPDTETPVRRYMRNLLDGSRVKVNSPTAPDGLAGQAMDMFIGGFVKARDEYVHERAAQDAEASQVAQPIRASTGPGAA